MAKVVVVRASGNDEGVVGQYTAIVDHPPVVNVDSGHLPQQRPDILIAATAIPWSHLTCWKQKAYFLRFRKHKSNKINDIVFFRDTQ